MIFDTGAIGELNRIP